MSQESCTASGHVSSSWMFSESNPASWLGNWRPHWEPGGKPGWQLSSSLPGAALSICSLARGPGGREGAWVGVCVLECWGELCREPASAPLWSRMLHRLCFWAGWVSPGVASQDPADILTQNPSVLWTYTTPCPEDHASSAYFCFSGALTGLCLFCIRDGGRAEKFCSSLVMAFPCSEHSGSGGGSWLVASAAVDTGPWPLGQKTFLPDKREIKNKTSASPSHPWNTTYCHRPSIQHLAGLRSPTWDPPFPSMQPDLTCVHSQHDSARVTGWLPWQLSETQCPHQCPPTACMVKHAYFLLPIS